MSALYAKEFEKWLEKRKIFLNDHIKSLTIIRDKVATQNPFYNYLSFQISECCDSVVIKLQILGLALSPIRLGLWSTLLCECSYLLTSLLS